MKSNELSEKQKEDLIVHCSSFRYCSKCGYALREGAKFCESCGKKIVTEKEMYKQVKKEFEEGKKQESS